ncbi:MAG: hypothetical protein NZ108_02080 [Bacteroidia bacterium]|nr:hypothetical protein [Bacteroidia bacterium]
MPYLIQTNQSILKKNLSFFFLKPLIGFTNTQLEMWGVFNTYTKIQTQDFSFPINCLVLLSEFNNQVYFLRQSKFHVQTIEVELTTEICSFSIYSKKTKTKRVWFSVFDLSSYEKVLWLFHLGKYSLFPETIKEKLFLEYRDREVIIRTSLYHALYPSEHELKALARQLGVPFGELITSQSELISAPNSLNETISLQWIE